MSNRPPQVLYSEPSPQAIATLYGYSATAPGDGFTGGWTALSVDPSGNLNVNAEISAAVVDTGNRSVLVVNTAPIPISGVVQASVAVVDTGDRSVRVVNTAPINISGIVNTVVTGAMSVDTTSIVLAQSSGNAYLASISGSLSSNLNSASWVTGLVTTQPVTATVSSNSTPSGNYPYTGASTSFGQVLAANVNRVSMFVQNTHTGIPLYVNLGTAQAGTGAFSMILNPSTVQGWGGSSFSTDKYRGAVTVSGGAWIAWEL